MLEKSCGTIPYTVINGTIHYLLVKAKDDGYCGFPKGHVEINESEEETALRETLEETSVNVQIDSDFRYEISFPINKGHTKTVIYFLAKFQDQTPKRNPEFEDFKYLLLPFNQAIQELTFENAKQMLRKANDFLADAAPKASLV